MHASIPTLGFPNGSRRSGGRRCERTRTVLLMSSSNEQKAGYWLDLAAYDLETADVMLRGKRYLYVGFMCHQVVEKSLKGTTWALRGVEPE